jgi:acyl-coenzyme A thioesterase PaaI-like protein
MSFLNPGKIGENILIKAESLKFGKTLCYSQAEIYNQDLRLLTTGRHVKAVVSGTFL